MDPSLIALSLAHASVTPVFLMRKVPEFVRSCDLACGLIIVVYCVVSVAAYVCCVCVIVTICVVFVCLWFHLCDLLLAPPSPLCTSDLCLPFQLEGGSVR